MKKLLFAAFLLVLSGTLSAQNYYDSGDDAQRLYIAPQYFGAPTEMDYFYLMPMDERLSIIYGSQYRRASNRLWAGRTLGGIVAPVFFVMSLGVAFDDDLMRAMGAIGIVGLGASLGVGIPLWVRGRREMDVILDDYARRYAPRPYSPNLSLGATRNGVGLALQF